jgi:hypothetical protein
MWMAMHCQKRKAPPCEVIEHAERAYNILESSRIGSKATSKSNNVVPKPTTKRNPSVVKKGRPPKSASTKKTVPTKGLKPQLVTPDSHSSMLASFRVLRSEES